MAEITTIYTLQEPGTHEFRYVGATKDFWARLRGHKHSAIQAASKGRENNRIFNWIAELHERGVAPWMEPLEEVEGHAKALEREPYWIARLFSEGHPLLNREVCGRGNREFCSYGKTVMRLASKRGVCGAGGIQRYMKPRGYEVTQNGLSCYLLGDRRPGQGFHEAFDKAFQLTADERMQYALAATFGHLQD